ncbi:hypothetical protein [Anaerosporobacter sp.]|uniref:hypothetical protein n=1 Tax=Anaerosporobacter sp. TaxID=1872529 RepID=UPI00286ECBF0|nr:hypothetical protein [Anaerosporobacter sp.]
MKIVLIFMAIMVLIIVSIPLTNNHIAKTVKEDLIKMPLPEKTEIVDSISAAGKLIGAGNGMQYLGAMLIKSELTLEELDAYYAKYREDEWDWNYQVEKQTSNKITIVEHIDISFEILEEEFGANTYYIVYTWGESDYFFADFDLRAH